MKINLLIPIEVDEDGKHCGGCQHKKCRKDNLDFCKLFRKIILWDYPSPPRLPVCLKAEAEAKEKA